MSDLSLIRSYNASILHSLEEGDLVEFPRGGFSHWAVYIGNEEVVHLGGVGEGIGASVAPGSGFSVCGVQFDKAKVCKDNFWTVVKNSMARKNNEKDQEWRPLGPAQIVRNALSKLGIVGYNLLFENCEHFAKWCRYGRQKSDQVENFVKGAAVALGAGLVASAAYAFVNSESEQEKKRKFPAKP